MSDKGDDTRVLNMRINNKDFLKGTSESLKALGSLNKGIDGAGKGKGLQTMAKDIDTVKTRFSAMQIAGVTALANITNRAVNAGINLVKSFTIAPIMDGFREYEKLLTSTQTIVANTGKSARTAGIYLDALNAYSDETVYNFGQMAENIGRFTAAGIDVKTATTSIKGLANAAALGGSTTEQLNNAMYQTSQALATGTIKLMDWNSLSQAGLGGKNIQNALTATASTIKGQGPIMDGAIKKYGSFRESLRTGWLTSQVFNKTMKVMAGQTLNAATSVTNMKHLGLDPLTISAIKAGEQIKFLPKDLKALKDKGFTPAQIGALELGKSVGQSAKRLREMGYSKEAAKNLAKLSQASIDSATKIKTFSQLMDVLKESVGSVWAGIFRQLFGNLEESGALWTAVGNKITGAVDKISRGVIFMLQTWHKMKDEKTGLNGYQLAWAAIGNVLKAVGNILKPFVVLFSSLLPTSDSAGSSLFRLTKVFYDFSVWLERVTSNASALNPVMLAIGGIFKTMVSIVGAIVKSYIDLFMIFAPLGVAIFGLVDALAQLAGGLLSMIGIGHGVTGIGDAISQVFQKFVEIRNGILEPFVAALVTIIESLTALVNGDISFDDFKATVAGAFGGFLGVGKQMGSDLIAGLKQGFSGGSIQATISGWVTNFLNYFKGLLGIHSPSTVFEEYGKNIVQGLVNGIKSLGGLIADAMSWVVENVGENFKNLDKVDLANAFSLIFSGAALVTLKRFMDGLGATMTTFKGFAGDIRENVTGEKGILNQTTKTMKTMQTGIRAKALLNIALAIGVLAVSLFLLSKIPADKMQIGLLGLAGIMAILVTALKLLSASATTSRAAIPILFSVSAALVILGTGFLILAAAMYAFSKVIKVFSKIDWKTFASGFGKILIVLLGLGAAMYPLASIAPGVLIASIALIALSVGLIAILGAIKVFEKVDFSTILGGVAKMAVVLLALGLAMAPLALLSPGILIASFALIVLSGALVGMLGVIEMFSKVSFGKIASGAAKIAVALVVIGVAAGLAAVGFIALGVGALLIGVGLMAAGVGMGLLGAGLAVVAGAGAAAFAVLIAGIETFVAALPVIGTQLIGALNTILSALASRAPQIVDSLVKTITEVLRGLRELAPEVAKTAISLLQTLIDYLADNVSSLVDGGLKLISGFIQGLADGAGPLIDAVANLIVSVLDGLTANIDDVVEAGANFVIAFLNGIGEQSDPLIMAAGKMILDLLTAINTAVTTYAEPITQMGVSIAGNLIKGIVLGLIPDPIQEAFVSFVTTIVDFFKGLLGINSPSTVFAGFGRNIVEGLRNGITGAISIVTGAISSLVGSAVGAIKGLPGKMKSALSGLGGILKSSFSSAFNAAMSAINSGVNNIGTGIGKIVGKIQSVASRVLGAAKTLGKNIITGIGQGIGAAGGFVTDLGAKIKSAINSALHLPKRIGISVNKGPIHISTGVTIPAFVKGTDYFKPKSGSGAALVGEAGPELVSMNKGSAVITNKNLAGFIQAVSAITRTLADKVGSTSTAGQINYVVGADFRGDPKASGTTFAANIVAGLVGGLQSNQAAADSAMAGLGSGATQSFADILGIKSPSTVFHQLATFVSKGFINGLVASTVPVQNAAAALANAGLSIVSRAVSDSTFSFEISKAFGDAYSSAAELVRKRADKADKKGKKGKSKAGDREAKRLNKQADALDNQSKKAAATADRKKAAMEANEAAIARAAELAKAVKDKDLDKVAEMKQEDALSAANAASAARQKAIQLSKEAKLVEKYDKGRAKKLRAQAATYEAQAKKLGAVAGTAAGEAVQAANAANAAAAAEEAKEAAEKAAEVQAQLVTVTAEQVVAAQKAFDDYSKQMSDVSVAAAQDSKPQVTYEQNIYAPEALSDGEIYRQSKNLLSMTEKKLVGSTP